jgi:hypothetical protein
MFAALGAFLIKAAPVIMAGAAVYGVVSQSQTAKKAAKSQEELAKGQLQAQSYYAGEHLELTAEQMQLQAGQRQIDTLATLIQGRQQQGPQLLTLPTRDKGLVEQINQKIDQLLRG